MTTKRISVFFYASLAANLAMKLPDRIKNELWPCFEDIAQKYIQRPLYALEQDVQPGIFASRRVLVIAGDLEDILGEFWEILKAKHNKVAVLFLDTSPNKAQDSSKYSKLIATLSNCSYLWRGNQAELPLNFSQDLKRVWTKLCVAWSFQ